jgi:rSAM/selenodomain-associated transferase 1
VAVAGARQVRQAGVMLRTLLIFAKPPRRGLSKTRLARGVGAGDAARVSRHLQAHTLAEATDPRWQTRLCVAPDSALTLRLPGVWPADVPRQPQGRGDLGARLEAAFAACPPGPVCGIGADLPGLHRGLIAAAFRALGRHGAVLGPAADGGFWLLGLVGRARGLSFQGVRWSSPYTMADVIARLPPGTPVAFLPTLTDIDEAADLSAWAARGGKLGLREARAGGTPCAHD